MNAIVFSAFSSANWAKIAFGQRAQSCEVIRNTSSAKSSAQFMKDWRQQKNDL